MSELPRVFDERGYFEPLSDADVAALGDERRSRYEKLADAARTANGISAALVEASDGVKAAAAAIVEQKDFIAKSWPPITFHQLWKDAFGRR